MNRRHFLALSHGAVIAGGFLTGGVPFLPGASKAVAASSDGGSVGESQELKIADLALGVKLETLPEEVTDAAKRVLLDTLGCAFGAVGSEPVAIAENTIRRIYGSGWTATIIGYPVPATVDGAIFVNGVLVRTLDLNDTYIGTDPLHPRRCCRRRWRLWRKRVAAGGS